MLPLIGEAIVTLLDPASMVAAEETAMPRLALIVVDPVIWRLPPAKLIVFPAEAGTAPRAASEETASVPLLTVVVPLYVLFPLRASVPGPDTFRFPDPPTAPVRARVAAADVTWIRLLGSERVMARSDVSPLPP